MAQSGRITAPSGADENLKTLGDPTPQTDTLAGVIRAALKLASAIKGVIINFSTGKAVIVPTGYAAPAPGTPQAYGSFTKDDPSKAASPWTYHPGDDAPSEVQDQLAALVAARKPSMSVESMTNAIEDAATAALGGIRTNAMGIVLHYDQADGELFLVGSPDASAAAYDPAAAYAEDAAFLRTVESTSTQFGE